MRLLGQPRVKTILCNCHDLFCIGSPYKLQGLSAISILLDPGKKRCLSPHALNHGGIGPTMLAASTDFPGRLA